MLPSPPVSRKLALDAALFLAATLVLGTIANIVPSRHLAWWGKGHEPPAEGTDFVFIDPGAAELLRESLPDIVFLDDRSAAEYQAAHVPGAVRVNYTNLASSVTPELDARLRAASVVVVYGTSEETDVEQLLAQELRHGGLAPPQVMVGGFPAWQAAGLPVESAGGAS